MIQSRGRWWQNTRLCGYYARAAAAVLVTIGLAGITGVLSWQFPSGVYHVAVGLFFAYVGLFVGDPETVRQMVGGLGVLLLVVKVATILLPLLWQEHLHWGTIEVTCLLVGITSILAAKYLRSPRNTDKGLGKKALPVGAFGATRSGKLVGLRGHEEGRRSSPRTFR